MNNKMLNLVFLFIICTWFPKGKLIADVTRSRYGEVFVRRKRKFEKNHYKLWKSHPVLRFLIECKTNNLISK